MSFLNAASLKGRLAVEFTRDLLRTPGEAAGRMRLLANRQSALGYIGWTGHDNLGDEAMFDVVSQTMHPHLLRRLFPEPGERLLGSFGLAGLPLFKGILLGGGTLINRLHLPLARLLTQRGLPLYTVGTGVGNPGFGISQNDRDSLADWAPILCRSSFVSVRGPYSARLLHEAGIENAEIIGDPALGMTPAAPPGFRTRQRLIINLARESPHQSDASYTQFCRAAENIAREFTAQGGEIVGVALGPGDRQALKRFRMQARLSAMRIEEHRRCAGPFLRTVEGSLALIGVRLHAAVLAACCGVPSILLAYRAKCLDFMSSMGVEQYAVAPANPKFGAVEDLCHQLLEDSELGRKLYDQALFWRQKQLQYYDRLLAEFAQNGMQYFPE